jgi:tetratricopeptide (TPR) repeat protein
MRPRAASVSIALASLFLAPLAGADTIVLKNGRKIVASHVTESGGKVTYQTPAGELSIPESIVDRIEKDDLGYSSAASCAKIAPINVQPIAAAPGYDEVAALTIHSNSVDFAYLAQLDQSARSGSLEALSKDATAHHAAAQYLAGKGDANSAIAQYKQALVFAPKNVGLLLNLAVLYLRGSQFTSALETLELARRVAPDSPDVAKLEGWAYYGANKVDRAVQQWQIAQKLRPDPDVAEALAKAEKDKTEEESYREGETAHFDLKYSGAATPELAREILRTLEGDFGDIESQLDYTPPEQIGVILYTNQAFADITKAPGWVGALNDGRLRIPVQGLTSMTPELAHVLKHELTHSFVGQKTHQRASTWLQEGIAQYMEGNRSGASAAALLQLANQGSIPPLSAMEGSWMNLSGDSAAFAYAWSLATVEAIVDAGGIIDLSRLLDRVATAPSTESALQDTLRQNYSDLSTQTISYLKRRYTR